MKPYPLVLAGLLAAGCESKPPAPPPPAAPVEPVGPPSAEPLEPGTLFPPLQAVGWVNGPPPSPGSPGMKGMVVDLWAGWCPYCRRTGPQLVALHAKYGPQGVQFVSLTNMDRPAAEAFVQEFGVTWPSGYGAAVSTFAAYGAHHTAIPIAGYEVFPTIYVLNPDGTVLWCDQRARARHVEPEDVAKDLAAAIDRLLLPPAERNDR